MTPADPLARLEKWSHGHKERSVSVDIDDSYGATCWTVRLGHEHGVTIAAECAFMTFSEERGGEAEYRRQAEAQGCVFVKGEDDDGWPGLDATVRLALDAFDRGVWGPRKPHAPIPRLVPSSCPSCSGDVVHVGRDTAERWACLGCGAHGGVATSGGGA